tara:strand:- start:257 stop:631 length:375 start_codon:yes stop_codon:yes gene_type:complete
MQATDYNSYTAYTTAKANLGLQVIPQELFDSLKSQDRMIAQFKSDMLGFIALAENKEADGSINWNFIDADMYVKWSVLLEGEEYTNWFDAAADDIEVEGDLLARYPDAINQLAVLKTDFLGINE